MMTDYLNEIHIDLNQYVLKYGENYCTLRLRFVFMSLDKDKFNCIFNECLNKYSYLSNFIFNLIESANKNNIFTIEEEKNSIKNINILKSFLKESFNSDCMKQIIIGKLNFDKEDYIYE